MSRFSANLLALRCVIAGLAVLLGLAVLPAAAAAAPRVITPLDDGWQFVRQDVQGAEQPGFDASQWQTVSLPHTYNAEDDNSGHTFYRGPAWYRRSFVAVAGKRTFIEFDGAALKTEVWLNGHALGRHDGGFARFRFDLTPFLVDGKNLLAVRVDNRRDETIAPLSGDFNVDGGLYRRVRLVTVEALHFDLLDYGSSGIRLRTPVVDAAHAVVKADLRLTNETAAATDATLVATIFDANHRAVAAKTVAVKLAAGATTPVTADIALARPHLWNGVKDPYLYQAEFSLSGAGARDAVSVPLGIRTLQITAERGLLLNGKPYSVHGLAIHHPMRPGRGVAVDDEAVRADYAMLREMGATGLRFAHYQHGPLEYDLADRMGLLVWTEVPFVGAAGSSDAFRANLAQQMRELIRQNVNHPSVMVWGIGNEVDDTPSVHQALEVAQATAKQEDASRPTTYAACCGPADHPRIRHSDVIAYNQYLGWYRGEIGDWSKWLDDFHRDNGHKPMAISEYGAGASAIQQQEPPQRPSPYQSPWHPEQWQTLVHEGAWRAIAAKPWLWASFIWVGFDFPSAVRNEGDHPGRNDKGIITYDRKIKKDAYFWYQANWTDKPMVYIASRRYTVRAAETVDLKVYCNQPTATVRLNGRALGRRAVKDHIAVWTLRLRPGANTIAVQAGSATDQVQWFYQPGSTPPGP